VYPLQSFQKWVDESAGAVGHSCVDSLVTFVTDYQGNAEFVGPASECLFVGVQDRCEPLAAYAGDRLLPDKRIV
jgi:hypothetical protein